MKGTEGNLMRHDRGLSALEVLLSLSVLALVVVIALPRVEAYQALINLRRSGRTIAGDLRLAQQLAISRDENYRWSMMAGPPVAYTVVRVSDGMIARDVTLPPDVTVTVDPAGYEPEFTPNGAPVSPGGVCLADSAGNALSVTIRPGTGRITILDGFVEDCAP